MREDFLLKKLKEKSDSDALRGLRLQGEQADYFSNDYLGIVKNGLIEKHPGNHNSPHGSTGSRLLAGNNSIMEEPNLQ